MGKADLHMHTCHSDGRATVRELLDAVRNRTDLDVIAITDHDTLSGADEAREMASDYPFEIVAGEEISTLNGHLIGLFLEEPVQPKMTIEETVREVHVQGGLAYIPHPFFWNGYFSRHYTSIYELGVRLIDACVDGIEVVTQTPALRWANNQARRFADDIGCLAQLAGSGTHDCHGIGRAYTLFPGGTAADLRAAIVGGYTHAVAHEWSLADLLTNAGWYTRLPAGEPEISA